MTNQELFQSISEIDGRKLIISLDKNFDSTLTEFRSLTSEPRTINGITYPAVYLSSKDFGGLTVQYNETQSFQMLVNLQFYYVYGFYMSDGTVYAFQDDPEKELQKLGFETTTIPYGDGYYDIKRELGQGEFDALLDTKVSFNAINSALDEVNDQSISFTDKARSLLIVLWSLVEGIRFEGISSVVHSLITNDEHEESTYSKFYDLAEKWSKLCVKAVNENKMNPDIAVYDLDRVLNGNSKTNSS